MSNLTVSVDADLNEKVREIIADVLEVETFELTEDSSFEDDFGADSLLTIEMFARFEKELGIAIPQDEMAQLDTLDQAYSLVARNAAQESAGV
ncbi:acyl carrier protein [Streptomyces xanthochromogenes]|uniref:acyl carrier protein n=1 Tax=Streptomyces xanthochromogenes TaxID=67384 RepID=UPI00343CB07D